MQKISIVHHIQESIEEKSQFLEQWMETSPLEEIETCLRRAGRQDYAGVNNEHVVSGPASSV